MTRRPLRITRPGALAGPAAALLVLSLAAPSGAVVTILGGNFVQGDATNEYITVRCNAGVLTAGGATGDPCAGLDRISVYPGDGADTVYLDVTPADFPALVSLDVHTDEPGVTSADTVNGSPTHDTITGDSLDTLNGGDGNDAITGGGSVSGGLGDDTITEFLGTGTPTGGPGDDRFLQFLVTGGVEGGDGFDSYEVDFDKTAPQLGADLTLELGAGTMHVVAGPTDAVIPIGGIELVDFTLFRGDVQTFDGAAFGGMARIRGMAGVDTLTGGALDDTLWGGGGNDTVTGGGGSDDLRGGDGDDTINARDGVSDRIDCGAGTDTVVADAADALTGCENVDVPAAPAPAPPPAPPAAAQAPETSAISGKSKVAKPKKAKFRFSSTAAGATFECKLDKGRWKKCSSPHKVATKKLKAGKHKLRVRAVLGGLVDATPSKKTFKVKRRR